MPVARDESSPFGLSSLDNCFWAQSRPPPTLFRPYEGKVTRVRATGDSFRLLSIPSLGTRAEP